MKLFLAVTIVGLVVANSLLFFDFFSDTTFWVVNYFGARSLIASVWAIFLCYFALLFAPMKRKDALAELLLVFSTLLFVPIFVIAFAFCYIEFGLDGACSTHDSLYFSVVTFTTLGYGDITPSLDSRFYAALEAITGFVFVPILFAQFVNVFRDLSINSTDGHAAKSFGRRHALSRGVVRSWRDLRGFLNRKRRQGTESTATETRADSVSYKPLPDDE